MRLVPVFLILASPLAAKRPGAYLGDHTRRWLAAPRGFAAVPAPTH